MLRSFVICFKQLFCCFESALSHFVSLLVAHTSNVGIFFNLLAEDDEEECRKECGYEVAQPESKGAESQF